MYQEFKAQKKRKNTQKEQIQIPKKDVKRPEWNGNFTSDPEQFKLSAAQLAREQWKQVQEQLKNGVVDDDTQKILDTVKGSKIIKKAYDDVVRKNLSQMIDYNRNFRSTSSDKENYNQNLENLSQRESIQLMSSNGFNNSSHFGQTETSTMQIDSDKMLIKQIDEDLKGTREFIKQMQKNVAKKIPPNPATILQDLENISKANRQSGPFTVKRNSSQQQNSTINNSDQKNQNKTNVSTVSWKNSSSIIQNSVITTKGEKINFNTDKQRESNQQQQFDQQMLVKEEQQIRSQFNQVTDYFSSLNKIEDTIQFMEQYIIGGGSTQNATSNNQKPVGNIEVRNNTKNTNLTQSNIEKLGQNSGTQNRDRESQGTKQSQYQSQCPTDIDNDAISFSLTARSSSESPQCRDNDPNQQKQNDQGAVIRDQSENHERYQNFSDLKKINPDDFFYSQSSQEKGSLRANPDSSSQGLFLKQCQEDEDDDQVLMFQVQQKPPVPIQIQENKIDSYQIGQNYQDNIKKSEENISIKNYLNQVPSNQNIPSNETNSSLMQTNTQNSNYEMRYEDINAKTPYTDYGYNYQNSTKNPKFQNEESSLKTENCDDDEELKSIQQIKEMLESTKKDIEQMNSVSFEFPHLNFNQNFGQSLQSSLQTANKVVGDFSIKVNPKLIDSNFSNGLGASDRFNNFEKKVKPSFDEYSLGGKGSIDTRLNFEDVDQPREFKVVKSDMFSKNIAATNFRQVSDNDSLSINKYLQR